MPPFQRNGVCRVKVIKRVSANNRKTHIAEVSSIESRVMLVNKAGGINGLPFRVLDVTFLDLLGISCELCTLLSNNHWWESIRCDAYLRITDERGTIRQIPVKQLGCTDRTDSMEDNKKMTHICAKTAV